MQGPKQLPLCRLVRHMHNSFVCHTEAPRTSSAAASGGVIAYMRQACCGAQQRLSRFSNRIAGCRQWAERSRVYINVSGQKNDAACA